MLVPLCLAWHCLVESVAPGWPLWVPLHQSAAIASSEAAPKGGRQAATAAAPPRVRVQFAPDRSTVALAGRVRGYQTVDYVLQASPEQRLTVRLSGASRYLQMGLYAPDGAALCVEACGREWTGLLPRAGDYVIRVGLVRAEARRQGRASYTLGLSMTR